MAPATGHLLLPKIWRFARFTVEKASRAVRNNLPESSGGRVRLQPAYICQTTTRQPINRAAAIRQSRSRFYSTHSGAKYGSGRSSPTSRIHAAVNRLTTTTPFASTLRPNLTGGTLGRTAGGYSIGAGRVGGARYFSHSPASPAEVINNVSVGVRAFWLSGQKARFDGIDPRTGEKRYKAVSALQYEAERKMYPKNAPGSFIDFQLSPTITAFGSFGALKNSSTLEAVETLTLSSEGVVKMLSADFARALKDFAAIINDLNRLSTLGDLPISLHDKSIVRVRFPGCDMATVESLCDEVGVQRGYIQEDENFDASNGAKLALLFPFAPSKVASEDDTSVFFDSHFNQRAPEVVDWRNMISPEMSDQLQSSPYESHTGLDYDHVEQNPWAAASSPSGYSSLDISELGDRAFFPELSDKETCSAYEGIEGIHRFIEECDRAAAR
ncbi:hypothetical protein FQN54_005672 [Arachnomyces sp. PD_36]|nr:hypothetical protein FQN54_005672 [Arachnomyces sp. PD_36]